ncbi:unnamed protein product, partial [Protopolystoma xenopodis]
MSLLLQPSCLTAGLVVKSTSSLNDSQTGSEAEGAPMTPDPGSCTSGLNRGLVTPPGSTNETTAAAAAAAAAFSAVQRWLASPHDLAAAAAAGLSTRLLPSTGTPDPTRLCADSADPPPPPPPPPPPGPAAPRTQQALEPEASRTGILPFPLTAAAIMAAAAAAAAAAASSTAGSPAANLPTGPPGWQTPPGDLPRREVVEQSLVELKAVSYGQGELTPGLGLTLG